jgi:methylmalonyl-CoA/ethylmalonyl-CoA epimerase
VNNQNLGSRTIAQIAIVVRDIERVRQRFADLFGLPLPNIITTAPGNEANMTYRGENSNAQAKLTFFQLGQVQLELIEPLGGDSTWQEVLDRRGEGVHHIAFWTEDMQASADCLQSFGVPVIQRGDMGGGGQYAYFDSESLFGVMMELLERETKK